MTAMDSNAVLVIGSVVGTFAKVLSGLGLSSLWNALGGFLTSVLATWIWIYSHGGFNRLSAWDDFAGFASVLLVAAGAFHVIENSKDTAANVKSLVS